MSRRPGWWPAVLVVLAVNAVCLGTWGVNRWGPVRGAIEMTERELPVLRGGEENSHVRLGVRLAEDSVGSERPAWADSAALVALGFLPEWVSTGDSVTLSRHRPLRRPAWVLLRVEEVLGEGAGSSPDSTRGLASRLVPVAVGADPEALYRASGDRDRHLVWRGVVRVRREWVAADSITGAPAFETWTSHLDLISPRFLHVPRTLVSVLDRLAPDGDAPPAPRFEARVVTGRFHFPRVLEIYPAMP